MVVDEDLLAESIVPQAEHDVDHELASHILPNGDRARHAHVVVGMRAVVQRREGQIDRRSALRREPAHTLQDLTDVQRIRRTRQVSAVQFATANGDEHNIILLPVLLNLPPHRGLDV